MEFIDQVIAFFRRLEIALERTAAEFKLFFFAAVERLRPVWRGLFGGKNILILGAKQSGKTALIHLMTDNHPYELLNGQKVVTPTFMAAVIGREVDLSGPAHTMEQLQLGVDIAGEARDLWKLNIRTFNPEGIIYMIDGRLEDEQLQKAVQEALDDVLSCNEGLQELKAFHLFVNFSDIWNSGKHLLVKTAKLRDVSTRFTTLFAQKRFEEKFPKLNFAVHAIHLSKEATSWTEAVAALQNFGTDLNT